LESSNSSNIKIERTWFGHRYRFIFIYFSWEVIPVLKKGSKMTLAFSLAIACILVLTNAVHNEAGKDIWSSTENSTTVHVEEKEEPFGAAAYSHVEFIQDNLSMRLAGTSKEKETAEYIQEELKKAGYSSEQIELQTFGYKKGDDRYSSQNIIVTKSGSADKVIVVGAHYDSAKTHGVDDNGSGVAVLLETAARLKEAELPYTLRFAFFGAEESGHIGSQYYVDSLQEGAKSVALMINVDSILAGDKEYLFGGTVQKDGSVKNRWALDQAVEIADELGLEMHLNPGTNPEIKSPAMSDSSDHVPFEDKGIPYVYFGAGNWDLPPYGPFQETEKLGQIMHTDSDDLDVINENFKGRAEERLADYSRLLNQLLRYIKPPW
jgi:Zn-dependent M28 family amino/carboxypeptidase